MESDLERERERERERGRAIKVGASLFIRRKGLLIYSKSKFILL